MKQTPAKKKATAKKAAAKKTSAKKPAAKKAAKATARKTTAKTAAKKPAAKKTTAKKATAKTAAKKPAAKKTTAKKTAAKKTTAQKTTAKKTAAKKTTAKKKTAMKTATKPLDVAALIARIEARAKAAGVKLPKGASDAAIAQLEKTLGFALPDDMKAYYRAHDGGPADEYVLENRELLSLSGIANQWKIWKKLYDAGTFDDNHAQPGPGVQKRWWIPEWVPVTYDGAGNHHVVDLAPGPKGVRGQVLSFWHDDGERRVVGKSFLQWLAAADWREEDDDDDE